MFTLFLFSKFSIEKTLYFVKKLDPMLVSCTSTYEYVKFRASFSWLTLDSKLYFPQKLFSTENFDLCLPRKIQWYSSKLMRFQIVESECFIWENSIEISHYDALEVGCVLIPSISNFNASVSLQTTQINLLLWAFSGEPSWMINGS